MTIKRIFLSIVTFLVLILLIFSLGESFQEPQVQSDLELSQANLLLQASELKPETLGLKGLDFNTSVILGKNPVEAAQEQYQSAQKEGKQQLTKLENEIKKQATLTGSVESSQGSKSSGLRKNKQNSKEKIGQSQLILQKIALNLGLITARQDQIPEAIATWQAVAKIDSQEKKYQKTALILLNLWSESNNKPINLPEVESQLQSTLNGWFRYQALEKLYQVTQNRDRLQALEISEQAAAKVTLFQLGAISLFPILFGLAGCGILIFLLTQWLFQKEESILASYGKISWETPWDGDIIWQVLVLGFFLFGQIILPVIFGFLHFNPAGFSLRGKAAYVLVSYLAMTAGGLGVLYFSIKPYFPLPKGWFQFNWRDRWFLWGFGGYLVAMPLVVLVSLFNQTLWHGQGGSNPLLSLALESQDKVVLAIFFFTASIAAPFFEEMMFRGFLIPSLTRYVPIWGAIAISSVIFAVAHLNLSEVLPLLTLGVILGMVYSRSQNLMASMLLHGLWNSGTLVSLFILGSG